MKKVGIVLILMIITLIVVFSASAFAFYSSARAELTFTVGSEVGASIGLNLVNSDKVLRPARTTVDIDDYSKANTNNNEQYAVYLIQYNAASALNVNMYIVNVQYKDKNGNSIPAADVAYLDSILKYSLKVETSLTTYNLNNLHTLQSSDWKLKYDSTNAANTSFNFPSIAQGTGYVFCYVKFDVSQDLLKPQYDDMSISFVLTSSLVENNP